MKTETTNSYAEGLAHDLRELKASEIDQKELSDVLIKATMVFTARELEVFAWIAKNGRVV